MVPLQDEESTIIRLLDSIACQTRRPEEVILVDAGSRDHTVDLITEFRGPYVPTLLKATRIFPGVARNLGAERASHEWIAFTDGGIRLEPDWLAELERTVSTGADVVFGNYEPICDSFFRECAAVAYVGARQENGTRGYFIASSVVRRTVFEAVGGFPAFRSAEDLVFVERLVRRFRIAYAPSAVAHWEIAGNAAATYRRFREYSYHNILAARTREWQLGVARSYAALTVLCAGGLLLGAGHYGLLLLPAFFLARALKAAWLKRGSFAFRTLTVARVLGVAAVLTIIDAGTIAGSARWVAGALRRASGRVAE